MAEDQRGLQRRVGLRELWGVPARSSTKTVKPDVRFSGKILAVHGGVADSSLVARAKNFKRLGDGTLRVHLSPRAAGDYGATGWVMNSARTMELHVTRYSRDWRANRMDRSQPLCDAAADPYTAAYFVPQTLWDRVVSIAEPCGGRPHVHAVHKRLVAAILTVCVGVTFVGPARAQGGTTGASSGIPLWLPPTAYAPPPGPVHHRQPAHGHGRYRSYTTEQYHKKHD